MQGKPGRRKLNSVGAQRPVAFDGEFTIRTEDKHFSGPQPPGQTGTDLEECFSATRVDSGATYGFLFGFAYFCHSKRNKKSF